MTTVRTWWYCQRCQTRFQSMLFQADGAYHVTSSGELCYTLVEPLLNKSIAGIKETQPTPEKKE